MYTIVSKNSTASIEILYVNLSDGCCWLRCIMNCSNCSNCPNHENIVDVVKIQTVQILDKRVNKLFFKISHKDGGK